MAPLLLGQRWAPDGSGKVEALMMTDPDKEAFPNGTTYLALQICIYDPNNAADVEWRHKCTGGAESILMDAHGTLIGWGIEDGSITDLGTLIAKRQADQKIIDAAVLQMGQNG